MAYIKTGNNQPGILELLFYKNNTGNALSNLANAILIEKSPLSSGERELIASYVSFLNECEFCHRSHKAAANAHLRDNGKTISCIIENLETANISEKGLLWASDYWSANVYQQASNSINTGDSYGKKGDSRWQTIALSEGWANYREELLARSFLNKPNYIGTSHALLSNYVTMFKQLRNLGCSYSNLEKSLCTYSISGYKSNLISYYPNLSTQITNVIKNYE